MLNTVPSAPGIPLPERMRPNSLAEFVGQEHLVGPGAVLRKMIESGNISSFILWGPPGVGKTTLAHIVSKELHRDFYTLSAISSGVKDLRDVFARAKDNSIFAKGSPILFIDEIHRFSKSQQASRTPCWELWRPVRSLSSEPLPRILPSRSSRRCFPDARYSL